MRKHGIFTEILKNTSSSSRSLPEVSVNVRPQVNGVVFLFLTYYPTARYDDGFFFPIAFVIAAVYGWWSKNYLYSFLVGFFSIPLITSFFPPYFIPFTFVTNFSGLTN